MGHEQHEADRPVVGVERTDQHVAGDLLGQQAVRRRGMMRGRRVVELADTAPGQQGFELFRSAIGTLIAIAGNASRSATADRNGLDRAAACQIESPHQNQVDSQALEQQRGAFRQGGADLDMAAGFAPNVEQ